MKKTIIDSLPYLHPFFGKDVFDLKDYPIDGVREKVRTMKLTTFDLSMLEDRLRLEIKYYLQDVLSKKLSKATLIQRYLRPIRHLINFLIQKQKKIPFVFFPMRRRMNTEITC